MCRVANNAQCGVCLSGQCQLNPDTGGTTIQFRPGPPEFREDPDLVPCS